MCHGGGEPSSGGHPRLHGVITLATVGPTSIADRIQAKIVILPSRRGLRPLSASTASIIPTDTFCKMVCPPSVPVVSRDTELPSCIILLGCTIHIMWHIQPLTIYRPYRTIIMATAVTPV